MNPAPSSIPRPILEREFKLRSAVAIRDESVAEALVDSDLSIAPVGQVAHRDVYLDDEGHRLVRAGRGLRLRRSEGKGVLCCKDRGVRDGALLVRDEIEAAWEPAEPPGRASELPEVLRDATEPFVEDRPLRPFLQLDVERRLLHVRRGEEVVGELALDRVVADVRGRTATFFEVELEVWTDVAACARAVERLVATLPVEPAPDDKLAHALELLAAAPQPPATWREGADFEAAAGVRFAHAVDELRCAEARVRSRGCDDDVHRFRTACRRLRVWLRALRETLPGDAFAWAQGDVVAMHRAAARARALGVFRNRLSKWSRRLPAPLTAAVPDLHAELGTLRESSVCALVALLRGEDHRAAMRRLDALPTLLLASIGEPLGPTEGAQKLLRRTARRFRRLLRRLDGDAPWEDLHAVRLAAKALQVLATDLEAIAPIRPRARRELARGLARLGRAGDAHDAAQFWLELARQESGEGSPLRPALLGALATRCANAGPGLLRRAHRAARRLRRRRVWRDFAVRA